MTEVTIKSYLIMLKGKAELPEALDIGHNYHVALSGSITTKSFSDNEDGTQNVIYTFKPVKVEVLKPTGEAIKAKDTRSNSQLIRSLVWKKWKDAASEHSFEDYYTQVCGQILQNLDRLIDSAGL